MAIPQTGDKGSNLLAQLSDGAFGILAQDQSVPGYQLACFAVCKGTPPTTAGLYSVGCLMLQLDGSGVLKANTGTVDAPVWTSTGTLAPGAVSTADLAAHAVTGAKVATNLTIAFAGVGVDSTGGPANATVTGVKAGDILQFALNVTDGTLVTTDFAATANGNNTISQTGAVDLSAKTIQFLFLSQQA